MLKTTNNQEGPMGALTQLESKLGDVFVKNAPFKLPASTKKVIVQYLPWVNLFLGVITLWAAWALYRWADVANTLADDVNELYRALGSSEVFETDRFSMVVWLAIAVLAVEAVIYILAFPGTRDKKKSGWNLLFYALLLNVAYGVVTLFTDYGGVGNLIGTLVGTVIGMYFLFQIRDQYS